jgi:hypothetical protein
MATSIRLFSYGTLQQREVQLSNYGRELEGQPDVLDGYTLEPVAISRPDVVDLSGKAIHTIARPSDKPSEGISGMVYLLTQAELAASDAYEDRAYERIEVMLRSGRMAWAYVAAGS